MATEHKMEASKSAHVSECGIPSTQDDEMQLPAFKFDPGSVPDDEDDESDGDEMSGDQQDWRTSKSRKKILSTVWVVLCAMATLNGRRMLMGGFPMYYVLQIQLGAYTSAVAIVVLLQLLGYFRTPKRRRDEKYKVWEYALMGFRVLLSSSFASVAMLCVGQCLLHFPSLPLLAMLPIVTYVFDSILSRFAYVLYLIPRYQDTKFFGMYRVFFVVAGVALAVPFDYRLNVRALAVAIAGYFLFSLSRVASKLGPRIPQRGATTWERSLQKYLLGGIPPLIIAAYATLKYENLAAAVHISRSWTWLYRVAKLGPAVILQVLFSSSVHSAYPFASGDHVGGALEEESDAAGDAAASTLQAGFLVILFGVMGRQEQTLIVWVQVIAFVFIYIISVGPKAIGYYPPRVLNLILRVLRRRPIHVQSEPWHFSIVLLATTSIFAVLISSNAMLWIDTIAYNRSLARYLDPKTLGLDTLYRPPVLRSFDMIIAHSPGDPLSYISTLIATFATHGPILNTNLKIKIYTQDPSFAITSSSAADLRNNTGFDGEVTIQTLRDIGGVSAVFLHHILYSWETMPVQSLFLSTASFSTAALPLMKSRLQNHYLAPAFPIPDALPKTGFLNLGEYETCSCSSCFDSLGWDDSFKIIPSMWAATRPGAICGDSEVLLTYGNNFVTTAARIRGAERNVWQTLYDGLTNADKVNAWAHDVKKLPVMLEGEKGKGRWAEGSVYGEKDSLQSPYLGLAVERLWGILLQCSEGRVAWRCPSLEVGWRLGGEREDCGCVE